MKPNAPKSPTEALATVHLEHPTGGKIDLTGPQEWVTDTLEKLLMALGIHCE